ERIHLRDGFLVVLGDREAGVMKRLPRAVTARQRQRRGLADLAHAERKDKAFERNGPTAFDCGEQVAHRGFAVTFDLLELYPLVALRQREDIGRLLDPALFKKELDLLFAEPVDVEGAPRGEQFQVLDLLE